MTERLQKLESQLAALRPTAFPKDLERRIGREIESKPTANWADRTLWSVIVMGAMAACVIVGVLVHGAGTNVAPAATANLAQGTPSRESYPLLMARANPTGLDELK